MLMRVSAPVLGVGVWVRLGLGVSSCGMGMLSGSRSTPVGRRALLCACACGGGVCLLLCATGWWCVVVWWVVCDLYSGCEHLVLFCGFV